MSTDAIPLADLGRLRDAAGLTRRLRLLSAAAVVAAAALALVVALQVVVVHVPVMQEAFTTVALTGTQWLVCVAMASVVLWGQELVKLGQRTWEGRRPAAREPESAGAREPEPAGAR